MSYQRASVNKRKLQKLYKEKRSYPWVGYNEKRGFYKLYYKGKVGKYLKKLANHKVRRSKNDDLQHGDYKKLFDYQYSMSKHKHKSKFE